MLNEWYIEREKRYLLQLAQLTNRQLFDEFEEVNEPDDYDGEFTSSGSFRLRVCTEEFIKRLTVSGWMDQ